MSNIHVRCMMFLLLRARNKWPTQLGLCRIAVSFSQLSYFILIIVRKAFSDTFITA